jgi:hypothetical protein
MNFCNFIEQRLRADDFQIPPHRQAVSVVGNPIATPYSDSTSNNFDDPNRPAYITAHLQAHKADAQKLTCKRAVILPPHGGQTLNFEGF